jgi:hypothetical protein
MKHYWKSVNTLLIEEFESNMNFIRDHNMPFYQRLIDIGTDKWASSMFPIQKFGKKTNNPAGSINAALKPYIHQDITNLIISINNYVMSKFSERRQKRFHGPLVNKYTGILQKNLLKGRMFSNLESSQSIFLVNEKYTVNLENKTCTCKESLGIGIPCVPEKNFLFCESKIFFLKKSKDRSCNDTVYGLGNLLTLLSSTMCLEKS